MANVPEERLSGETLYHGRILSLRRDRVRLPSGREAVREVVEHAVAVGIVAENDHGEVLLIRQYRYPVGEVLLEIPAGLVDPGETPLVAAHRELREETGFDAREMHELGRFFTSPGFCDEELILFQARDLIPAPLPPDQDETIVLFPVHRDNVVSLLRQGALRDGKTVVALCRYLWCGGACRPEE